MNFVIFCYEQIHCFIGYGVYRIYLGQWINISISILLILTLSFESGYLDSYIYCQKAFHIF